MKVEILKQEKFELNKDTKNSVQSKNKKKNSDINSQNVITTDCSQKQNKNEVNSDKSNQNIKINENNPKISLNKEQLYETFLLFQDYLSEKHKNKFDNKTNDISQFNLDNEEQNKIMVSNLQLYKQNKIKKNSKTNLNDLKNLNHGKKTRKKYINESFTSKTKNINNECSFDFSNKNMNTYSGSIGNSLQIIAYNLLNNKNKNKLNAINISNKTTKLKETKNICDNLNNKTIKNIKKREIVDYKNKENELMKNINKIKVLKNKEEDNKNTKDKSNREQIIENKIKELNYEIIKFKEEKDKVINIKNEYEKLHEKLIKDIEDFQIKKENFEKYKEEEINKIKNEKEKILMEKKELNNIKIENQPLNISKKSDKEIINDLKKYISELKTIIQQKDNEIKSISQSNKINNYIINTYKTINTNECFNKKSSHIKSYRTKTISNELKEETSKEFIPNLSYTKINNMFLKNNFNKKSKSNSLINININEYSKIDKIKEKNTKREIKGNKIDSNFQLNTSMNIGNKMKKIKYIRNKDCINKEKKIKKFPNKKVKKNNDIKNKFLKNKEDIKISDIFSKTATNFMQRKKLNKEEKINCHNDNKNMELEDELNKPLNPSDYDFIIPEKYSKNNYTLIKKEHFENKEICLYTNNKRDIIFPSGLRKEIFDDGFQLIHFNNGDIKQSYKNEKNIYFYKESNTIQTTYPNGINIFKFNNGQIEKHFPNGLKKIFFPNGTIDYLYDGDKNENIL